jgi:lipopolysaccharide/colanic/teichoic acid biosynthesis glycosyltransferase
MFKRFFAITGLTLLSPVIVTVGLLIKIDSPGPIFYRGVRTGRYGVPFRIFKFRTMHPNMEKQGGDTTAFADSRVTRAGRFLRKYKIDELPQFLNVLKGEMSIVGPRPELLYYTSGTANRRNVYSM